MSDGAPNLSAKGLGKRYGKNWVLREADLELAPGQVLALLGEHGAGKSTLVKILSGAVAPDTGTVEIGGEVLAHGRPDLSRRAARAERQILSWFREGINAINKWALMTPKQLSQVGDYHALVEEMRPTIARNPDLLRKEKHRVQVKIRRMLGYTCSQAYAGCASAASYVPEELPERDPEESADGQRFIDLVRQFKSLDSELEKNDTMRTTHYKMLELQSQIIDKWAAFKDKQQGVPDIADVLLDDWVVVGNSTLGYMGCGLHD